MAGPTNPTPKKPAPVAAGPVGPIVYFYGDHKHAKGMKSLDDDLPFTAIVASVTNDRLVNLLVIDHMGSTFPVQAVPLYCGDDEDDKTALYHCELEAPKPKEIVTVSGVEGQPIALNLALEPVAGNSFASVKLTFTVPIGATYTLISEKAAINQAFAASGKPQSLTITGVQIAAGALTDLSITVNNDTEATLAIVVVEQDAAGVTDKTYRLTEVVTVSAAPAQPAEPAAAAVPPASSGFFAPPPQVPLGPSGQPAAGA
jgi:hypothetical protein